MAAILRVCAGRLAALPQLSGEGTRDLTARLSVPPPPWPPHPGRPTPAAHVGRRITAIMR
jgi:hypothetical protein